MLIHPLQTCHKCTNKSQVTPIEKNTIIIMIIIMIIQYTVSKMTMKLNQHLLKNKK